MTNKKAHTARKEGKAKEEVEIKPHTNPILNSVYDLAAWCWLSNELLAHLNKYISNGFAIQTQFTPN